MQIIEKRLKNFIAEIQAIEYSNNSFSQLDIVRSEVLQILSTNQTHLYDNYLLELNEISFPILIQNSLLNQNIFHKSKLKLIEIITKLIKEVNSELKPISIKRTSIFLVHGHKKSMKESVARFLERQNINTIILDEKANSGATIFEKFEQHSDVSVAVILISGDDKICGDNQVFLRARQNVIFEYGYFCGKIGRKNIIILQDIETKIELPSDVNGVVSIEYHDNSESWKQKLGRELKSLRFDVSY